MRLAAVADPPRDQPRPAMLGLLRELGDLKRIRSAGRDGSIATRLFGAGWAALAVGEAVQPVMARTVAAAIAAARLGDLDYAKLRDLGLDAVAATTALAAGFDAVADAIEPQLAQRLRAALGSPGASGAVPDFVALLAAQPRAGVTCPGRPRLMLEPAENHAEHCLVVAVYAALLAPDFDADPAAAFMAGMVHHLHSAAMPDSGFTGEMLLGDRLAETIAAARAPALAELPPSVAATADRLQAEIADDRTPVARSFHAADAIDRVLEIEQHLRRASVTMTDVLDTYGLVHDGPVKAFHDRILADYGLL